MSEQRMTHDEAVALAPAYVLGALETADIAAVREHLATCLESHAEFERLGGVVPYLLESPELELVEPPASLRDRVMAAATADLATREGAPSGPIAFPSAAERESRGRTRSDRIGWAMRIAAVVAIVVLGGWNLLLQDQLRSERRFDQAVAAVISAAAQPGSQTVILAPAKDSRATGIAAVRPDGSVVLAMRDLPPTSGSQVYETWMIAPDAAPVPVGGFTVDANGTVSFTTRAANAPPGATIAVTREPKAGNLAPEGPIVSAGVVVGPPT
jgi:anti-sigma-K factor RskA